MQAIDAGMKAVGESVDRKVHDANAFVDNKREELGKVYYTINYTIYNIYYYFMKTKTINLINFFFYLQNIENASLNAQDSFSATNLLGKLNLGK